MFSLVPQNSPQLPQKWYFPQSKSRVRISTRSVLGEKTKHIINSDAKLPARRGKSSSEKHLKVRCAFLPSPLLAAMQLYYARTRTARKLASRKTYKLPLSRSLPGGFPPAVYRAPNYTRCHATREVASSSLGRLVYYPPDCVNLRAAIANLYSECVGRN